MDERLSELREDLYTLILRTKRPKRAHRSSFDERDNAICAKTFRGTPDSLRPDLLDEAVQYGVHFQLTSEGFTYYFPGFLLRILDALEANDEAASRRYASLLEGLLFEEKPWKVLAPAQRLIARDVWDLGKRRMPDAFWRFSHEDLDSHPT